MHRPRTVAATAVVLLALGLAGCGSGHKDRSAPSPSPTTASPSASPTTKPAPKPAAYVPPPGGWLSGKRGPTGPVFAIKVDNALSARPLQEGLQAAQVVYQELVEGGATRFMGMYVGGSATSIGPIRSARDTDIELLAEYGRVVFGFSGANSGVMAHIDAANVINVANERHGEAYVQRGRRVEAYNFYTTPAWLLRSAGKGAVGVKDVGFRFGPAPKGGRPVVKPLVATFSPYSHDYLRWDGARHGWRISQDGTLVQMSDGAVITPPNVLVQFVPLKRGRYADVLGYNSPDSSTLGRGKAVLLRGGKMFTGTWVRPTPGSPTRWLASGGGQLTLLPGQTWVLLVPNSTTLHYS